MRLLKLYTFSWYPWLVWGLASSAFLIEYLARVSPGVMIDQLMHAFKVQALALGNFSAFFYYAYVGMQLPVGLLVDRFKPGRLLAIMVGVCALGCCLFSIASTVAVAAISRFIMGLGAAFAFVSTLKLASQWFPANRFGLLVGLTQSLGMLGAAVAQAPFAFLVRALGWRETLTWLGLLMGMLAIIMLITIQDKTPTLSKTQAPITLITSLKHILMHPQNRWNALFSGLLYAPTAVLAELWGVKFYRQAYGISNELAAVAVGMIFAGWTIGGVLTGWLSDRWKQRRKVLQYSAGLSLVTMSIALFSPQLSLTGLFTILFVYGLVNTGVTITYVVAAESNTLDLSGTVIAFTNMASILVGVVFQLLIGSVLDYQWDHQLIDGVPVYQLQDFKMAMATLPIALLLACGVSFKIKETYGAK